MSPSKMFTRKRYKEVLKNINLSKEQTTLLRDVLEEMMAYAQRLANVPNVHERTSAYYDGKTDGINAVDRFLRGDMDCHDEFENESD